MLLELLVAAGLGSIPPLEYRDNGNAIFHFRSYTEIQEFCTEGVGQVLPDGWFYKGCAGNGHVFTLNPCLFKDEYYARHLCHEMGHINGWPGDHPNAEEYIPLQISVQKGPAK